MVCIMFIKLGELRSSLLLDEFMLKTASAFEKAEWLVRPDQSS